MANTKIQSEQIADSAIVTDRIAADAITTAKIADNVALGGSPTTTTQSGSDNSTKIATTAYVTAAVADIIDSAPSTLNTLNEIAAALNDDANFNTTVTNSIAAKLPLAGGTMTGQLLINVSAAGTTAMDVQGAYSSGGDVKLAQFKRSGGAVATAIEYNDATTDMELGTVTNHAFSLKTNDTRRLTISNSGNASFTGTISSGAITITDGTTNGASTIGSASDQLLLDTNADTGLTIRSGASSTGVVSFASPTDHNVGQVYYDHNTNSMVIRTDDATALTLDSSQNIGVGLTPSGYLTNGYKLRLYGGTQTYLAFNNSTHTTQVLGGFVIGNDASAARITQRENQPIVIATNDTTAVTIQANGQVAFAHPISITTSSSAEIELTGSAAGNLVAANDLYILAGSGTSSGNLYLGSEGTNAQVILDGGQLGIGESPRSKLYVRGTSASTYTGNGPSPTIRAAQGTDGNWIASDVDGKFAYFGVDGNDGKFAAYNYASTAEMGMILGQNRMYIKNDGRVGIATTDPKSRLSVSGALTLVNGHGDFGTHTYSSYASVVSNGEINFTVGYSGTLTAARNFVFTYEATSWKAWGCEIEMASTEGLATWKVGGYNNNSGGNNSYEENDENSMASLSYSNSGQQNIITLDFSRQHIHPVFKIRYFQSGGDGAPRMDRVKVEIT